MNSPCRHIVNSVGEIVLPCTMQIFKRVGSKTTNIDFSSTQFCISFVLVVIWLICTIDGPACHIRLELLPLPLCFLHKTTTQAFSSQHVPPYCILGGAIVINLFSHRKIFMCTLTCRWLCKSPSAFRKSYGVVKQNKPLID